MARWRTCLLIFAAAAAGAACGCSDRPDPPGVRIGRHRWRVELAADPDTRRKGLSGRKDIPAGTGMLFVFPDEAPREFWMHGCVTRIDVAFISSAMEIVEIRTMEVEPDPLDTERLSMYPSREPMQYALEVAGGTFERLGIRIGHRVELLGAARGAAKDAR